jgi:hypothetical protein
VIPAAGSTQTPKKLNEWGLCKKFRAEDRANAIAFNPTLLRGTATQSEINVVSTYLATPLQDEITSQSLVAQSPLLTFSDIDEDGEDDNDEMISLAYDEIGRPVSRQAAEYIFQPLPNESLSTNENLAGTGLILNRILSISTTESELIQLRPQILNMLLDLAKNLWNAGYSTQEYCAQIAEVHFARDSLLRSEDAPLLDACWRNLALIYLKMGRWTRSETFLTKTIAEIDSFRPGDVTDQEFLSILSYMHSIKGRHVLAEELCRQLISSLRSAVGLFHVSTCEAYNALRLVLEKQERADDGRRLVMGYYTDVYRTESARVLPGLKDSLELCRRYLEEWMTESELRRMVMDRIVYDGPLSVGQRTALTLTMLLVEKQEKERARGTFPQEVRYLEVRTGLQIRAGFLEVFANLIALPIRAIPNPDSTSVLQEALRAVNDLQSNEFLVPLWIFGLMNRASFWKSTFDWSREYNDLVQSL